MSPATSAGHVRPFEGGARVEVVDSSTVDWTFSTLGVEEPGIASCATLIVPEESKLAAEQALKA